MIRMAAALTRLQCAAAGLLLSIAWSTSATTPVGVHLAGDSTMSVKLEEKRPETGWGEAFAGLFKAGALLVHNHARNGRSTRTFIEEGRWQDLLDALVPGELVLIQFGHNDQSVDKPDRYTPPQDYQRNLERFVVDVRLRGGRPVLLTPLVRRRFDEVGVLLESHGEYPALVRDVAVAHAVPLLDLTQATDALLRGLGPERSKALFLWLTPGEHPNYPDGVEDNTHFSPEGARRVAALVADALVEHEAALAALRDRNDCARNADELTTACQRD
jgi:lysophospholipase L1-like esterase